MCSRPWSLVLLGWQKHFQLPPTAPGLIRHVNPYLCSSGVINYSMLVECWEEGQPIPLSSICSSESFLTHFGFCCFQRLTQNCAYLCHPEVRAGGCEWQWLERGGGAFSSCMRKYPTAALLHSDKSSYCYRSTADEGQKPGLTLNPDNVVMFICILQQL